MPEIQQPQKKYDSVTALIRVFPYLVMCLGIGYIASRNQFFLSVKNLLDILLTASATSMMTIGMLFVLLTGGIDLSCPPVMALGSILGAMYMKNGGSGFVGALIILAVCAFCGVVNGFAVSRLKMVPFIVTMATQSITYGLCLWITQSYAVNGIDPAFRGFITFKVGKVSVMIIFMFVVMVLMQLFLKKSYLGRQFFYVGRNEKMAMVSGMRTARIINSAYVISGVMAGIAGIFYTARMNCASATFGASTMVMDIVGGAVVGGASVNGGEGSAIGAVLGAIFIAAVANVISMLNVSYNVTLIIKGMLILVFVTAFTWAKRREARSV